jgi:hypothetical protein
VRDNGPSRVVERLDVHAAGPRGDPHLATGDGAVEDAVLEPVDEVRAEDAETRGGKFKVVRSRKFEQHRPKRCQTPSVSGTI